MNKVKSPILVLGCHRSGTSLVAGLIHNSGVHMVNKVRPHKLNEKGMFEDLAIERLNERILKHLGGNWKTPPTLHQVLRCKVFDKKLHQLLITYRNKFTSFGWKDPRLCITFPLWIKQIKECNTVICIRRPLAVAESLVRVKKYNLTKLDGIVIWKKYNNRILHYLKSYPKNNYLIVEYSEILNNKKRLYKDLCRFLGLKPDLKLLGFIDRKLCHSSEEGFPDEESRQLFEAIKNYKESK